MTPCVYGLIDPRTGELRYIGKAQNLTRRLRQHLQPSELRANTYKVHWIKELLSNNLRAGDRNPMYGKKRRGAACGRKTLKLSDAQVQAILNDPRSGRVIAEEYGVHKSSILRVKRRQSYVYT